MATCHRRSTVHKDGGFIAPNGGPHGSMRRRQVHENDSIEEIHDLLRRFEAHNINNDINIH